jgi:hypothetical protein
VTAARLHEDESTVPDIGETPTLELDSPCDAVDDE